MSIAQSPPAKVAILLGTYQGAKYLSAQLASFTWQTYPHWELWSSDDGSTDDTLSILATYQQTHPHELPMLVRHGPRRGFVHNFMSMVLDPMIKADYYAYADQDDIWEPDKLMRALTVLRQYDAQEPALYCSRTSLINEHDQLLGYSRLQTRPPSFANALVQNIASGNTMVFNNAARELLLHTSPSCNLAYHDWWTYLVISYYGGAVYYDHYPSVRYRQHRQNVIGYRAGLRNRLRRLIAIITNKYKHSMDNYCENLLALIQSNNLATTNNQLLANFITMRNGNLLTRLRYLAATPLYRQNKLGNLGLYALLILGKI